MNEYEKYENMDLNELDNEDLLDLFEGMIQVIEIGYGFDYHFSVKNLRVVREILSNRLK